jgi:hypothetical protein
MLTPERVHVARTSGLTDTYLARIWRLTVGTVRDARLGLSWKSHPTPPDTARRDATGSTHAIRAGLPQKAVPARVRRSYFNLIEGKHP